ncbi:MAG: recombinase family protein [Bacteriovorax sp.]|nr:recombinase family protein [Bacteriovorax sp.]
MPLREISLETGIPKSTIRDVLVLNNVPLRSNKKTIADSPVKPQRAFRGAISYGYNILDGKIVIDPREIKIVRKILALHQKGMSFNAISIHLSNQKIPSKLGKRWNDKTVASIIRKHPSNQTKGETKGENNG